MEGLLAALEASAPALWLKASRWGYLGVNAAHILGIALLVGAMVPLNLVRLGGGGLAQDVAARLLVPFAGAGLALALFTGLALFSTRASEYAALGVFGAKIVLVAFGVASALALHALYGLMMQRATPARRAVHAALSLATWLSVLVLGRAIAFA